MTGVLIPATGKRCPYCGEALAWNPYTGYAYCEGCNRSSILPRSATRKPTINTYGRTFGKGV